MKSCFAEQNFMAATAVASLGRGRGAARRASHRFGVTPVYDVKP